MSRMEIAMSENSTKIYADAIVDLCYSVASSLKLLEEIKEEDPDVAWDANIEGLFEQLAIRYSQYY